MLYKLIKENLSDIGVYLWPTQYSEYSKRKSQNVLISQGI